MNETIRTLTSRKSCRKFRDEPLKEDDLDLILCAGTYAPTGRNRQAPVIVAVTDSNTIRKLSALNAYVMGTDSDPFYGAPAVAVVLSDRNVHTYIEDGSLVIGNMLNAAYSLGVGGCWIHRAKEVFELPEGKELLKKWGLSDDYVGIGNCILGYPDGALHDDFPRKDGYVIRV